MTKDTPIILSSAQGIMLTLLETLNQLTFATAIIVLFIGSLYLLWSLNGVLDDDRVRK